MVAFGAETGSYGPHESKMQRVTAGMLAAALFSEGDIGDQNSVTTALRNLTERGRSWLEDPQDPRGAALRSYAFGLSAMIAEVDRGSQE